MKIHWIRPSAFNVLLVCGVCLPHVTAALAAHGQDIVFLNLVLVSMWLFIPCSDKRFGKGSPGFWMRQSVFVLSSLVILVALFWK